MAEPLMMLLDAKVACLVLALLPATALICTLWPVILALAALAGSAFAVRFLFECFCGLTLYGLDPISRRPTLRECLDNTLGSFR